MTTKYAVRVFFDDRPTWQCWVAQLADNAGMFGRGKSQDQAVDSLVAAINRHAKGNSSVYTETVSHEDFDVTIQ